MDAYTLQQAGLAVIVSLVVSMAITGYSIGYARRKGMLDHPGQRRSHSAPTPRGGGVGLVAGTLSGLWIVLHGRMHPAYLLGVLMLAGVLVAIVGWCDDRRGLAALPRLLAHFLASAAFVWVLVSVAHASWWWVLPLVGVGAWSINLHNFMDGIDGLLGLQLVFVGLAGMLLCTFSGMPVLAATYLVLSAAATGFLVFNLPPARIFMGDVGSGYAGMLVFMLGSLWWANQPHALWAVLALHAVFVTDATLTLLTRMRQGRRWYTAHREHLYQYLVRSGLSHGITGCLYLSYNIVVVAPLAWLALERPAMGPYVVVFLYTATAATWWLARRHCMRKVTRRHERACA